MQTWPSEKVRNTRFGTNRGRLPDVFRHGQATRRLQPARPRNFVSEKHTEPDAVQETGDYERMMTKKSRCTFSCTGIFQRRKQRCTPDGPVTCPLTRPATVCGTASASVPCRLICDGHAVRPPCSLRQAVPWRFSGTFPFRSQVVLSVLS